MNISKLIHVTSLFFLIFLISFQVFAQSTYYVSPTGNDANDGSSAHPWLTIQGAINNSSVVNGDIIIVKDGTYHESINVTKGITIQSENGYLSTTAISTGTNQSVFLINGVNNVTIKGFTAYGATSSWNNAGVKLVNANNCTITNNRCGYDASHQNWKGIQLWEADNNTISNNICNFNSEIGIQLYGNNSTGSDNNLILNNQVSYNNGASSSFGIQIDGGNTTVNNIRGNVVENNGSYGVYIKNGLLNLGNNDVNDKGNNTIINNNSGAVQLYNAMSSAVNCYYNYWGNIDSTTIDSHIYDNDENSSSGEVFCDPWIDDPLPVELTTFTASVIGSAVKLNWQTATEVNNYGFEIERASSLSNASNLRGQETQHGNSDLEGYTKIGIVNGYGNSNSPKNYEYTDNSVKYGKYLYRLKQIDIDGVFEYSKSVEVDLGIPAKFKLSQNYPNPFNPTTTIEYSVPQITHPLIPSREGKERSDRGVSITLKIYDILGNEIATLVNEEKQSGIYKVNFDAKNLSSGIYYYQLRSDNYVKTKKMILVK